jgi:hypothetical protein
LEHRTLGHSGGSARRLLDLTCNGTCCCWGGEKGNVRWRQWLGILAAALLISDSAFAQSRLALVIGNSNYQTAVRLPNSNPTRANGWRKRSYRTPPSRAWRPLLSSRCRSAFTRTRPRSFAKGRAASHPVAQLGAAGTLFGAETASSVRCSPCMSLRAGRYR